MENLTVNFQLPAAAVFVPLMLADHRDNNYRSFEKKKRKKTQKEIVADILKRWD